MAERIPPGRAGELWLLARLDAAHRGRELLDRKRQLLRREERRLALLADERERAWVTACELAQRWSLRAGMLTGSGATELFAVPLAGRASVVVGWRNTMGVRHPDDARCTLPELPPETAAAGNAALAPAAAAHRDALRAAVDVAVAATARRSIANELAATQRRLRALDRHRIPLLERSLRELGFALEEREREERIITRWAVRAREARP